MTKISNRFALWALNEKDERILTTMELNTDNFNVTIKTILESDITKEQADKILGEWVQGGIAEIPSSAIEIIRNFTDESLLPDQIKVDGKSGAIRQLQNEWSYLLLSTKLLAQFNLELEDIKLKASNLKSYSHELFEEAKRFWERVIEYRKEKDISQDKMNMIKEEINTVFDHLKILKESLIKEKDELSENVLKEYQDGLEQIKLKLEDKNVHFKTLMDELKEFQNKLKTIDVKRDIKNRLFDEMQKLFETIKNKRDDVLGGQKSGRVEGLKTVMDRMQKSLDIDLKDLKFNLDKVHIANNKLELQLREAKINVIKDRIASKEEKLADIKQVIQKLEGSANKKKDEPVAEIIKEPKDLDLPEQTSSANESTNEEH